MGIVIVCWEALEEEGVVTAAPAAVAPLLAAAAVVSVHVVFAIWVVVGSSAVAPKRIRPNQGNLRHCK